jgi:hypothetical protein
MMDMIKLQAKTINMEVSFKDQQEQTTTILSEDGTANVQ